MPDLIRHPEHIEITGFRLGRHPGPDPGRNDGKGCFPTFYEFINTCINRNYQTPKFH